MKSRVPFYLLTALAACGGSHVNHAVGSAAVAQDSRDLDLVLVVEGHNIWMGNETYEKDPDAIYEGNFARLARSMDAFRRLGGGGSVVSLISYSHVDNLVVDHKLLADVRPALVGKQIDYRSGASTEVLAGMRRAMDLLRKDHARTKAIVLIGDGAVVNPDEDRSVLQAMVKQAETENIKVLAIIQAGALPVDDEVFSTAIPAAKVVTSEAEFAQQVDAIVAELLSSKTAP
ncbi:MAG TPA: hypothetical protein PLF40_05705 [Kofleriaceae bacterium]|nr:hypothetical protein [Kofleriaceae bacterium]